MKKRLIAWLLLLCMLLTACAPQETQPSGTEASTEPTQTQAPEPTEEPSIQIHYQRQDDAYSEWGFWLWEQGGEGQLFEINGSDSFGGVATYMLSDIGKNALTKGIGIIPRRLDGWTKDCDVDRLVSFSDYQPDEHNCYHLYMVQGDQEIYMDSNFKVTAMVTDASFTAWNKLTVQANAQISNVKLYKNGTTVVDQAVTSGKKAEIQLPDGVSVELGVNYEAVVTFAESKENSSCAVSFNKLYTTDEFNDLYYYDGELGAIYTKKETTFRVWSPVSTSITLNIYEQGYGRFDEPIEQVRMTRGDKGVFTATLTGDYAGKYYTYTVINAQNPKGIEIVDPYAKSAGLNGVRGMIVDFDVTDPDGWSSVKPIGYDRKELVVWETHVADVTSSKTWTGNENWRKKFLGMIQAGTTYTEGGVTVTTGFDHIKELGVNAVQLIPVFDQANNESSVSFNWGYNPLNYNVLEGAYSTNAEDGYTRINEFKQLVQVYNQAGINIIMDVVYNHVSSANGSNFDVLMPGYYFRYKEDGTLSNGSGCGNEMASENLMARKFIIDSVCFWAEEYKLGGFRFDLMGLHDIETMNLLAKELQKINPNIVIYGEPWTGGSSTLSSSQQAVQNNAHNLVGVGQFNDQMRDALIKGGLNSAASKGWITNNEKITAADVSKILQGLQGITNKYITDPNQTVNYVTCHDNYTLYDRIKAAGITDEDTIKKMALLANAVVMTSNGTSFMLAGEEFLRTKDGNSNSYESSYEVNELNYALKIKNQDLFAAYQALISFKIKTGALHLEESAMSAYKVESLADGAVIRITFHDAKTGRDYKIIHANGTVAAQSLTEDFAGYTLVLDTAGDQQLSGSTAICAYQTIIAYK